MSDIVEELRKGCEFAPDYPLDPESFVCHRIECKAAEEIESLRAEIARLREERRWVPVGERLPTVQGDDVLTARGPWEDGGYSIVRGWWNGECWMFYGSDRDSPPVAFWRPLPPGPEASR